MSKTLNPYNLHVKAIFDQYKKENGNRLSKYEINNLMKIAGITWKEKRMVGSAIHERYSENIYEATRRNLIQAARSFDYVKQEMVKERKLKWSNSQIWIFVLSTLDLLEKKPLRVGTQKDKEYLERLYKYVAQEFKKERGLTWSEARIRRFLGNLLGVKEMD